MAAEESLSPKQFYHGSYKHFEPGDELLPSSKTGNVQFADDYGPSHTKHVWVSEDAESASNFGSNLYAVHAPKAKLDVVMGYHKAPRATVIRKIDPDEEDLGML